MAVSPTVVLEAGRKKLNAIVRPCRRYYLTCCGPVSACPPVSADGSAHACPLPSMILPPPSAPFPSPSSFPPSSPFSVFLALSLVVFVILQVHRFLPTPTHRTFFFVVVHHFMYPLPPLLFLRFYFSAFRLFRDCFRFCCGTFRLYCGTAKTTKRTALLLLLVPIPPQSRFTEHFSEPIKRARAMNATASDRRLGEKRLKELDGIRDKNMIRRTKVRARCFGTGWGRGRDACLVSRQQRRGTGVFVVWDGII